MGVYSAPPASRSQAREFFRSSFHIQFRRPQLASAIPARHRCGGDICNRMYDLRLQLSIPILRDDKGSPGCLVSGVKRSEGAPTLGLVLM